MAVAGLGRNGLHAGAISVDLFIKACHFSEVTCVQYVVFQCNVPIESTVWSSVNNGCVWRLGVNCQGTRYWNCSHALQIYNTDRDGLTRHIVGYEANMGQLIQSLLFVFCIVAFIKVSHNSLQWRRIWLVIWLLGSLRRFHHCMGLITLRKQWMALETAIGIIMDALIHYLKRVPGGRLTCKPSTWSGRW